MSIPSRGRDAGFTLIELMVGALLTVLVLSLVGGIVISSTRSEGIVRSVAQATQAGQLVTSSVQAGIRNSAISLGKSAPFKLTTPAGSDQLLVALVVSSGTTATASCAAWYYSATAKEVRYSTSGSAIAAPNAATLATWTLLSKGVSPISPSTTIFSSASTYNLNLAFQEAAGMASPIPFQSSITSRTGMTGAIACF
jgi:type II secretory pathway pseudopilin PulG